MKKFKKQTGFTLMEVIIATVIVAVIASCLTITVPASFVNANKTENIAKASELASKYMETLKADLAYTSEYDLAVEGTTSPIEITSAYTRNGYFDLSTQITDLETETINGAEVPTLKEINVIYKKSGDDRVLAHLSTIIARPR